MLSDGLRIKQGKTKSHMNQDKNRGLYTAHTGFPEAAMDIKILASRHQSTVSMLQAPRSAAAILVTECLPQGAPHKTCSAAIGSL